jgi:hypothetical protein
MIEEVVGGGNVVEKASNRLRMEKVGFHLPSNPPQPTLIKGGVGDYQFLSLGLYRI